MQNSANSVQNSAKYKINFIATAGCWNKITSLSFCLSKPFLSSVYLNQRLSLSCIFSPTPSMSHRGIFNKTHLLSMLMGRKGGRAAVLFVGWALAGQAEAFAPAPGLSLPSQCRGGRGTAIPSGIVGIRSNNLYMLFYFTTYFISNPHFGASLASMQGVFVVV